MGNKEIIVVPGKDSFNDTRWIAYFKNDHERWASGSTRAEAIGRLIIYNHKFVDITITEEK